MQKITIEQTPPAVAFAVSLRIPEFAPWYPWEKWEGRLRDRKVISLVAYWGGEPVGFKTGYFEEGQFYSWVGGVQPEYRRCGIASQLADVQERLVHEAGITRIRMKTRNRFADMLQFATGRGFYIADVEQKGEPADWRITLYKNL